MKLKEIDKPPGVGKDITLTEIMKDLSPAQKESVDYDGRYLLVVSGAGSGKTLSLTRRIARLVKGGTPSDRIMVVTFTNKAADEFSTRLDLLLGDKSNDLWMATLHSIGSRVLRLYGDRLGISPKFVIYDTSDSVSLVRRAMADQSPEFREYISPIGVYNIISWAKERNISCNNLGTRLNHILSKYRDSILEVFNKYSSYLLKLSALDFADLINRTTELLLIHPSIVKDLGFEHILVDEYQDLNQGQSDLIDKFIGSGATLTVYGDPDQALYTFRGGDYKLILSFKDRYPGTQLVSLGRNFRSTGHIVDGATRVIETNSNRIKHKIWTENPKGSKVKVIICETEASEASLVSSYVDSQKKAKHLTWNDLAVISRTNKRLRRIIKELEINIDYTV